MSRLSPEQAAANWDAYLASREPKTEHELQVAVVNYCRSIVGREIVKERFAAIPNGAFLAGNPGRRAAQAAKLKAEGMRSGMPDMVFWKGHVCGFDPIHWQHAELIWLELKNGKKGRLSAEQKAVHSSLGGCGFTVLVIRTLDEARTAINQFYQS